MVLVLLILGQVLAPRRSGPLALAQILETPLLNMLNFSTLIATNLTDAERSELTELLG